MEDQGSACYSGTYLGPETRVPWTRQEPPGYMICAAQTSLPPPTADCAYGNDFFVKTQDSEPVLAPGFCFITPSIGAERGAHYFSSAPCFLMAQDSNKHFVQTEKPALLSEDREVRETRRRPFTDHKRDTQHKAGLGRVGGRA